MKKLEEIALKYSERAEDRLEESRPRTNTAKRDKSQIPIAKKKNISDEAQFIEEQNIIANEPPSIEESIIRSLKNPKIMHSEQRDCTIPSNEPSFDKRSKTPKSNNLKTRVPISRRVTPINNKNEAPEKEKLKCNGIETKSYLKDTSMSLDSLEDIQPDSSRVGQSIGIKTELLCVPCIIHENNSESKHSSRKAKTKFVSVKKFKELDPQPSVELLYKNPTMVKTCELRIKDNFESTESKDYLSISTESTMTSTISTCNTTSDNLEYTSDLSKNDENIQSKVGEENLKKIKSNDIKSKQGCKSEEIDDLSIENEGNIKPVNSHDLISIETSDVALEEQDSTVDCRFGSALTYTLSLTENPDDFEEFMTLTDQLINNKNEEQLEINQAVNSLHTPNTNSLETINNDSENAHIKKFQFSDTFQDLKNNFKKLIECSGDKAILDEITSNKLDDDEFNKKVSDMEHITVYELKFYDNKDSDDIPNIADDHYADSKEIKVVKLPSIEETNKPERKLACNKKRILNIYKTNNKFKMRDRKSHAGEDKTLHAGDNSDSQSLSRDSPPLKLPRIETKKRLDYFVYPCPSLTFSFRSCHWGL